MYSSSEPEIDLHMGHMSSSWSGHLTSCQTSSDLRTSNMLYENQIGPGGRDRTLAVKS